MPITRPPATGQLMRSSPLKWAKTTIQMGTLATSRAATPEGTNCSPQLTPPLPPARRSTPTIVVAVHWLRPGRSPAVSPRRTDQAYNKHARDGKTGGSHQQRRNGVNRDPDAEVGRAPDDIEGPECEQHIEQSSANWSGQPGLAWE